MLNNVAKELYDKQISGEQISPELYRHTATRLMQAVYEGLGNSSFSFEDPNNQLAAYLQQNIHAFSGAKSLYQMRHFANMMVRQDGSMRSFETFRNKVHDAGYIFNHTYLQTEYNTALASAQAAQQWQMYENGGVEYLEYSTVGDGNVRPEHAALDGFTAPITDKRWATITPPNGWNCRCTLVPGSPNNTEKVNVSPSANWQQDYKISKYFQRNSGQTKAIFDEETPIYKIGDKAPRQLLAIDHYGMRSVRQILETEDWPAANGFDDAKEALEWFANLSAGNKNIPLDTKTGFQVNLSEKAVKHILNDNKEERWKMLKELPEVLNNPDEVWSTRIKNRVSMIYLKYFEGSPIIVRVNPKLQVFTLHNLLHNGSIANEQAIALRKGALIYRK